MRSPILILAALMLASCGSSPKTHYFTLSRVPAEQERPAPIGTPVTVASVHVPQSLDRSEMVRANGDNTVEISDQERWTAPLGEMAHGSRKVPRPRGWPAGRQRALAPFTA